MGFNISIKIINTDKKEIFIFFFFYSYFLIYKKLQTYNKTLTTDKLFYKQLSNS